MLLSFAPKQVTVKMAVLLAAILVGPAAPMKIHPPGNVKFLGVASHRMFMVTDLGAARLLVVKVTFPVKDSER